MENKQTAVEWFKYQTKKLIQDYNQKSVNGARLSIELQRLSEQAKQMEKEQLEKFYLLGDKDGFESCYYHNSNCLDFEQYYNETYGKQDKQAN
jgi:hypothetical protein